MNKVDFKLEFDKIKAAFQKNSVTDETYDTYWDELHWIAKDDWHVISRKIRREYTKFPTIAEILRLYYDFPKKTYRLQSCKHPDCQFGRSYFVQLSTGAVSDNFLCINLECPARAQLKNRKNFLDSGGKSYFEIQDEKYVLYSKYYDNEQRFSKYKK
jgi:hypothetical protein